MTSPIQFPTLSPPQVIRNESGFGDLASLLVSVSQHRRELALSRERLEIDKQNAVSSRAEAGQRTAESAARTKAELARLDEEIRVRQAGEAAADAYASLISETGGNITPQQVAAAQQRLLKGTDKKLAQTALTAFNEHVKGIEGVRGATAARRTGEAGAAVAEGTTAPTIAAAQTAPAQAQATLDATRAGTANTQASTAATKAATVTQGAASAFKAWIESGRQWGEIEAAFPSVVRGVMPSDATFSDESATGGRGELASRARAALPLMIQSVATIDEILPRAGGVTVLAALQRGYRKVGLDVAINQIEDADQQQLIGAYRSMISQYNLVVSGAAVQEREFVNNLGAVAELPGDKPETLQRKAFMRQTMLVAIMGAASGKLSPLDAAEITLKKALDLKMPQGFVKELRKSRDLAAAMMGKLDKGDVPTPKPDSASAGTVRDILKTNGYKVP